MNIKLDVLKRTINKTGLKVQKHSPEILVVAGIVGVVTSAVLACKATTKLSTITKNTKEQVEEINKYVDDKGYSEEYTEEDHKKDMRIVYTKSALKVVKLYAPSVILGSLSIVSILASNNILRKRNVALAAAYTVVDKSFKEYRKNVIDRFGDELDKELKYGVKTEEIEKVVVDENGKETIQKEKIKYIDKDINNISDYARFFDDGNYGWEDDAESNLFFLKKQQEYANMKLQKQGYLFLNDVYDMLGIPRSQAGQLVGWIYKENEENENGDNFVDFGIYNVKRKGNRDFVNGYIPTVLLDFNVDGNILDLI